MLSRSKGIVVLALSVNAVYAMDNPQEQNKSFFQHLLGKSQQEKSENYLQGLQLSLQKLPDHKNEIEIGKEDTPYKDELLSALSRLLVCTQSGKISLDTASLEQIMQRKIEEQTNPFLKAESACFESDYAKAKQMYERLFPSIVCSEHITKRAHLNYAEALLGLGDYKNGFQELEHRLAYRDPLQKPWDGSDPNGITLRVNAEQGLGDTFFFTCYLPALKKLGAKIILQVQKPLQQLMSSCPYVDQVIKSGDHVPPYDYDVYLMSLPHFIKQINGHIILGTIKTPRELPIEDKPHIIPDKKIELPKGLNIGICWRASKLPAGQARYIQRDVPLKDLLETLKGIDGINLFSLQGGGHRPVTHQEYEKLKTDGLLGEIDEFDIIPDDAPRIYQVKDEDGPFLNTARHIAQLDRIVSVDTSIPNLAGAMRRPTTILLTKCADWRWLIDRKDSPWQPTIKLLRQQEQGNWKEVLKRLREKIIKQKEKL